MEMDKPTETTSSSDVDKLLQKLKDVDGHVRLEAVRKLGEIKDASAVEPLISTLYDSEDYVRWNAAEALGKIGDERAIPPLIAALADKHKMVQNDAANALRLFIDNIDALAAVKDYEMHCPQNCNQKQSNISDHQKRTWWYEDLRVKLLFFSAIMGILAISIFGLIARGHPNLDGLMLSSVFGSVIFASLVYHNIWFRQLSLPALLVGAIYVALKFRGFDLYEYFYLTILAIVVRMVIALVEARSTTGKYADFWRSFAFHPYDWDKEFGGKQ